MLKNDQMLATQVLKSKQNHRPKCVILLYKSFNPSVYFEGQSSAMNTSEWIEKKNV